MNTHLAKKIYEWPITTWKSAQLTKKYKSKLQWDTNTKQPEWLKKMTSKVVRIWSNRNSYTLLVDAIFLAEDLSISHKIKHKIIWEWRVPVLDFYPRKLKHTPIQRHKRMFIAGFIHKTKDGGRTIHNLFSYPSTGKWI